LPNDEAALQTARRVAHDLSKNQTALGLRDIVVTNGVGAQVVNVPMLLTTR
jgi:hypothetical protein